MLQGWNAVAQELAGKHRAIDAAARVDAVLLQPTKVEHSIVRPPIALAVLKEEVKR